MAQLNGRTDGTWARWGRGSCGRETDGVAGTTPTPRRDASELARRLGLSGRTRVIVVCGLVAALFAIVGVARLTWASDGFVMSSSNETPPAEASTDVADGKVGEDALEEASSEGDVAAATEVVVHVDGAVSQPGVYRLSLVFPRVGDAVEAAGGLAEDADTTSVNLAEPLVDGEKVHIARQGEIGVATEQTSVATPGVIIGDGATSSLVNVNSADVEELTTLPGIGDVTARSIVADRERNGPFATTDDLMRVDGIGEGRYAKIKDLVCV